MRTSPYLELVPRKACGDLCRALCRRTLSKMARNRTVRQSVRQRLATKWAERMVLGQALASLRAAGARKFLQLFYICLTYSIANALILLCWIGNGEGRGCSDLV